MAQTKVAVTVVKINNKVLVTVPTFYPTSVIKNGILMPENNEIDRGVVQ